MQNLLEERIVKLIKTILKGVVGLLALLFIVSLFLGESSEQRSASRVC